MFGPHRFHLSLSAMTTRTLYQAELCSDHIASTCPYPPRQHGHSPRLGCVRTTSLPPVLICHDNTDNISGWVVFGPHRFHLSLSAMTTRTLYQAGLCSDHIASTCPYLPRQHGQSIRLGCVRTKSLPPVLIRHDNTDNLSGWVVFGPHRFHLSLSAMTTRTIYQAGLCSDHIASTSPYPP